MPNRLVEYHLERLKDKNPEIRLRTIDELRLIGDPAALSALENLYYHDENEEVRKAAQRAGLEIFLKNRTPPAQA